jgi:hypothetical protein
MNAHELHIILIDMVWIQKPKATAIRASPPKKDITSHTAPMERAEVSTTRCVRTLLIKKSAYSAPSKHPMASDTTIVEIIVFSAGKKFLYVLPINPY